MTDDGEQPTAATRALPHMACGSLVRYTGPSRERLTSGAILVVLRDNYDKVRCAKLGGDEDRYWNLLPRTVEPARDVQIPITWASEAS